VCEMSRTERQELNLSGIEGHEPFSSLKYKNNTLLQTVRLEIDIYIYIYETCIRYHSFGIILGRE
jgi:hypothetical protein